jgi:hypothetical protein
MSTLASYTVDSIRAWNKAYVDAINPDRSVPQTFPVIITQPSIYNSKTDSAFIGVNPLNPSMVTTGFYKDLNKDKSVQKTLSKYYYYKILDKWMYNNLKPLLAFVDISSGKAQLIKSMENYDVLKLEKDSSEDIEKKIQYMEKILITKDMVRHVLKKICNENNINWYDLNKHEKKIRTVFYNYLLDKLKTSINKYGSNKDDSNEE